MDMIEAIRAIDPDHVIMVECISNDMFAMMLPLNYPNIVYSPHGYSPLEITHQGVVGENEPVRNKYPHNTATSNLGIFTITDLSKQHEDVRTFSRRFNVPVFVGEFSCVNWSPLNDTSEWTSTKWIYDNISLIEEEGWSWVYHNWSRGGEAIEWDPEIPSSFYSSISFTNARPNTIASPSDRSDTAPTIVMLKNWFALNSQSTITDKWGMWGIGVSVTNNVSLFKTYVPYIKGFLFRFYWKDIETSPGVFNWTNFDTQVRAAISYNLYVGFKIFAGPDAPLTWLSQSPYNVPTFTNERDTYPYYLNANYTTRYYNLLDNIISHLQTTFTTVELSRILYWQITEGTTGDEQPYHGTIPDQYAISLDDWADYKRDIWIYLRDKFALSSVPTRILINSGYDFDNFTWVNDNIPLAWHKTNPSGHTYNFTGELNRTTANRSIWNTAGMDEKRYRVEFENIDAYPWWQQSPNQNIFALASKNLHHGVDSLNISLPTANSNGWITNHLAYDFFNKYAGYRKASETNKGFIEFGDVIDVTDTTRFPTGTYGNVVTLNTTEYNNSVNAINADGTLDAFQKADKKSRLFIKVDNNTGTYRYLNPSRISAIQALFPGASYEFMVSQTLDVESYLQDYAVTPVKNISKFITQYSPDTTSISYWRVGNTSNFFGRFLRGVDSNVIGKDKIYLTCETGLASGNDDIVKIDVTYYDEGTGIWSVNCSTCKGQQEVGVVQNTNSLTYKTYSVTVDKFLFGGQLTNSSDIIIRHLSGSPAKFALVEIENLSKLM